MRRLLLLLPLLLAGCAGATTPAVDQFSGYYASGFEASGFTPCGVDEDWWVVDSAGLQQRYQRAGADEYEPLFVVVRGELSRRGRYGHLGLYQRELRVREVVRVDADGEC